MTLVPTVILETATGERSFDIYSRLVKDRIVIFQGAVDTISAGNIVAQLLHLESENPDAPIWLYINSPGGSITDGMAVYDTMNLITCPVHTVCMGMAASMGAFLLGAGEKGHRYALPNSEIMIHQPLGGAQGQATEIEIAAKRILWLREKLNNIIADYSGQEYETVCKDTDRDNFMTAEQAKEYGLIDVILDKETRKKMINQG